MASISLGISTLTTIATTHYKSIEVGKQALASSRERIETLPSDLRITAGH